MDLLEIISSMDSHATPVSDYVKYQKYGVLIDCEGKILLCLNAICFRLVKTGLSLVSGPILSKLDGVEPSTDNGTITQSHNIPALRLSPFTLAEGWNCGYGTPFTERWKIRNGMEKVPWVRERIPMILQVQTKGIKRASICQETILRSTLIAGAKRPCNSHTRSMFGIRTAHRGCYQCLPASHNQTLKACAR